MTTRLIAAVVTLLWCGVAVSLVLTAPDVPVTPAFVYGIPAVGLVLAAVWQATSPDHTAMTAHTAAARSRLQRIQLAGDLLIGGGVVADLGATLWFSPDLSQEANPLLRWMLDSGQSWELVVAYTLALNSAAVCVFCLLWHDLTMQWPAILRSVGTVPSHTVLHFLKASTGGGELSWRQWVLPLRISELPDPSLWIWPVIVSTVFGATLMRWYVALEWLGVARPHPTARTVVWAASIVLPAIVYLAVLHRAVRTGRHGDTLKTESC